MAVLKHHGRAMKIAPQIIIPGCSIIVTHRNNLPCLELRKVTTDVSFVKHILEAAFYERPILIQPKFTDRLKSVNTLVQKGILYLDEADGQYYFTI